MSVASFGRLQEPFRRSKMRSAKFRRHPRGLRNYFARPSYLHRAAKLASILRFPAPFSWHGSRGRSSDQPAQMVKTAQAERLSGLSMLKQS
uniref:Uncharacterized protein n=1 Tax=Vitis vinifera TaxID=29760 RepID=A5BQ12_VITVI|nr:hypothetical protein VITISV_001824 [Vitis vinifera]